jgi:hypothetical protein
MQALICCVATFIFTVCPGVAFITQAPQQAAENPGTDLLVFDADIAHFVDIGIVLNFLFYLQK